MKKATLTKGHSAGGAPPGNKNAMRHGLHHYKRLLSGDGLKRSTALYHALAAKEQELVTALGGDPSPQERAIIGDTVKTMLYIGSLDSYLMGLKSIVRKGRVHNALIERTRLAGHLRENLKTLGTKRVAKEIPDLARELQQIQVKEQAEEESAVKGAAERHKYGDRML